MQLKDAMQEQKERRAKLWFFGIIKKTKEFRKAVMRTGHRQSFVDVGGVRKSSEV